LYQSFASRGQSLQGSNTSKMQKKFKIWVSLILHEWLTLRYENSRSILALPVEKLFKKEASIWIQLKNLRLNNSKLPTHSLTWHTTLWGVKTAVPEPSNTKKKLISSPHSSVLTYALLSNGSATFCTV
jgi:hypothetical protein